MGINAGKLSGEDKKARVFVAGKDCLPSLAFHKEDPTRVEYLKSAKCLGKILHWWST